MFLKPFDLNRRYRRFNFINADVFTRIIRYFALYLIVVTTVAIIATVIEWCTKGTCGRAWQAPIGVLFFWGGSLATWIVAYGTTLTRHRWTAAAFIMPQFLWLLYSDPKIFFYLFLGIASPLAVLFDQSFLPGLYGLMIIALSSIVLLIVAYSIVVGAMSFSALDSRLHRQASGSSQLSWSKRLYLDLLEIPHAAYLTNRKVGWLQTQFAASTILYILAFMMVWAFSRSLWEINPDCVDTSTPDNVADCLSGDISSLARARLLYYLAASFAFLFAGNTVRRWALNRLFSAARLTVPRDDKSSIPTTLFLRSFRDDHVTLQEISWRKRLLDLGRGPRSLDAALAEELSLRSRLLAIGKPSANNPEQIGALRLYTSDDQWKALVTDLCLKSGTIVISLDDTEGLRWEFDQIVQLGLSSKTLFVFHPSLTEDQKIGYLQTIACGPIERQQDTKFVAAFCESNEDICTITARRKLDLPSAIMAVRLFVNRPQPALK